MILRSTLRAWDARRHERLAADVALYVGRVHSGCPCDRWASIPVAFLEHVLERIKP